MKKESSQDTRVIGQVALRANLQEFGQEVLLPRRNALGLTQQQMASRINISQSRLSRIEAGSYDEMAGSQFRLFVEAYKLTNSEEARWQSYLFGTNLEVPALNDPVFGEALVDTFAEQLAMINTTRLEGNISLGEELAASTSKRMQKLLAGPLTSPYREQLQRIFALVRLEVAKSYTLYYLPEQIVGATAPVLKEIREIARQEKELRGLMDFREADADYIAGNHTKALQLARSALENVLNANDRLWIHRTRVLCFAREKAVKEVEKVQVAVSSLMEKNSEVDSDRYCNFLEGFALAQVKLGWVDEAMETWQQSWSLLMDLKVAKRRKPFREVALLRTQLKLIQAQGQDNRKWLEEAGQKGLSLAREYGYTRYENQILDILNRN